MLDEYSTRIASAKRDTHLASQLDMIAAVDRGEFTAKPNGSDPDKIADRVRKEAEAKLPQRGDWNMSEIPGADLSHNRMVYLTRESSPGYFSARDRERAIQAEFEVTVRLFFLPANRR